MPNINEARKEAREREIGTFERHMFICIGPDCCSDKEGQRAWDHLKAAAAKVNKSKGAPKLYRTKVGCLRICEAGPTGVVYPDGTWYGCLTPANLDRVVEQHLIGGKEVEDLVIGRNPLPAKDDKR
jgi:(2Fe-2S) ferredoxin